MRHPLAISSFLARSAGDHHLCYEDCSALCFEKIFILCPESSLDKISKGTVGVLTE